MIAFKQVTEGRGVSARAACLATILVLAGCNSVVMSQESRVASTSRALGSGDLLQSTLEYRVDGLVTNRSLSSGSTVVAGRAYTLSPAGQVTEEDRVGESTGRYNRTDYLGRLNCVVTDSSTQCPTSATDPLPASVNTFAAYGADRLTNLRRRLAGGGIANTRLEYNFNFRNRPDRVVVSQGDCATASCETSFALAYDDWGNRATETPSSGQGSGSPSRQFTYGPDGRLRSIRVATPGAPGADCSPTQWDQVDTDVGYDQRGVLAFRRRRLGSTTQQVVRYSRTPTSEVGYTLQAEGPTGAARVTYKYLYLAGERVVAVRETWDGSTRTDRKYLFLHADRNGAPVAAFVADHPESEATQQWTADRDAWGWTTISSAFASSEMSFEFPGQLRLDGTEFTRLVSGPAGCLAQIIQPAIVSNGYRDYDPVAGIYLTRDPISRAGSSWAVSSANRNLYAYAGFNPIDRFDYWGLETPGGSDDVGRLIASFVPVVGPYLGMRDAFIQGDWAMAVMNASFLVLDLSSLGTAALARDVATGGVRALLSTGTREIMTKEALAVARNEAGQVAGRACRMVEKEAEFVERSVGAAESALSIAQRGGKHGGFLKQVMNYSRAQLERAARSFQAQIELHEAKIANPSTYIQEWESMTKIQQEGLLNHWEREISNFADQQSIVWALLGG